MRVVCSQKYCVILPDVMRNAGKGVHTMLRRPDLILFALTITISFSSCRNAPTQERVFSQEEERTWLSRKRQDIITFSKISTCTVSSECRFIGLGSAPCGGPRDYLIY